MILCLLVPVATLRGQDNSSLDKLEFHSCTAQLGVGAAGTTGANSSDLKTPALALQAGGGFRITSRFALLVDYTYQQFAVTSNGLKGLSPTASGGKVRFESVTLEPTFILYAAKRWNLYALAGFGLLAHATKFTLAQATLSSPGNPRAGEPVRVDSGAFDGGAGVNVRITRSGLRGFAELRYLHGLAGNSSTAVYTATGGIRW